ncbi:hypothetical protein [Actinokineospora inagensis]|uniref:hypothetical protein n=1 Tax=Actinokineospora inagensis TaxID=103730 RepID=UPI0012FC73A2|nr:hypothetical protein [Actinokineospora inagensis]
MSEQQRPKPVTPENGDVYLLSRPPQTTAKVLANAKRGQSWPGGVPSLVEDLNYVIGHARNLLTSLADDAFCEDGGIEVDNLDSMAYRVIEACRWLQVHQAVAA